MLYCSFLISYHVTLCPFKFHEMPHCTVLVLSRTYYTVNFLSLSLYTVLLWSHNMLIYFVLIPTKVTLFHIFPRHVSLFIPIPWHGTLFDSMCTPITCSLFIHPMTCCTPYFSRDITHCFILIPTHVKLIHSNQMTCCTIPISSFDSLSYSIKLSSNNSTKGSCTPS
jgi:hypothetical protein